MPQVRWQLRLFLLSLEEDRRALLDPEAACSTQRLLEAHINALLRLSAANAHEAGRMKNPALVWLFLCLLVYPAPNQEVLMSNRLGYSAIAVVACIAVIAWRTGAFGPVDASQCTLIYGQNAQSAVVYERIRSECRRRFT